MPAKGQKMSAQHKARLSEAARARSRLPEKFCPRCNTTKSSEHFKRRSSGAYKSYCIPCDLAYSVERTQRNIAKYPEKVHIREQWNRKSTLKRNHGLTPADYDIMYEAQGGLCAICKSANPGNGHKNFSIDHCHKTRIFRGLLCHTCNRAIGLLKDDAAIVLNAAAYITNPPSVLTKKKHSGRRVGISATDAVAA